MRTIIRNGIIITPYRRLENHSVVIENGKIEAIVADEKAKELPKNSVVDAAGNYVAPGFIDTHSHGGGGHDFMDGTVEAFIQAARAHLAYGTTSILPTTLTSTDEELFRSIDNFIQAKEKLAKGPELLGLHLEGPYFAVGQKGAQDPRYIKNPSYDEYKKVLDYTDQIKRWTIAPELPGALRMGRFLNERGVICSIGHSDALYKDVLAAVENGFTHITHLYSGMSTVRRINAHRYAGVVEAALLLDDLTVEIIADGVHLPESLLKLIYKIKGPQNICLVTDSMRAAGMPEGKSILGSLHDGQEVIVEDGVAKLLDRTAFAGSVATADRLVRTMVKLAEVPLVEAIRMMTLTPAEVMSVDGHKGSLTPGKDADLVIFDEHIQIHSVFVKGQLAFSKGKNE